MKQKLHERIVESLISVSRRHPWLKYPMLACIFVVLAAYHLGQGFMRQLPRVAVFCAAALVFLLCASFSEPEAAGEDPFEYPEDKRLEEGAPGSYIVSYEEAAAYILKPELDATVKQPASTEVEDDEHAAVTEESLVSAEELLLGYEEEDYSELSEYASEEELLESFDLSDWKIMLVNKQHPIPEDYEFELGVISGGLHCDARVLDSLRAMMRGAQNDGVTLYVCSPYRSTHTQILSFTKKIDRNMEEGMSYAEAYRKASQAVTIPGCSEHELGLAIDIVSDEYGRLDFGFGESCAGKWLAQHCSEYGFILRYPEGKEDITGIEYEPWHFRYVGVDAAGYIMERGLTLEEFTDILKER